MKDLKILYTISTYAFVIALIFVGGMYAGTKIISRLNDDELAELADNFESDLAGIRDEYRKTIGLLEQANKHLEDSAVEREQEANSDKQRISNLEGTVERLQAPIGFAFTEIKSAQDTVQQIEESTDGIRKDIQSLRSKVQKIQESKRNSNWWFTTGEYNPEDQWRRLIDRINHNYLYRDF